MKKLIVLVTAIVLNFNLFADEISKEEWKKMSRQERKEYRKKKAIEDQKRILQLVTSKAWVLEAHQLQDRYGESEIVEPSINFVGVAGEKSTVQLGASGEIGINGVGGITVDGNVNRYEVKEGKPGSGVTVRLEVSGAMTGHVSMLISISNDGTASATLRDIEGGRITYRGRVVALGESTVYKGQTLF